MKKRIVGIVLAGLIAAGCTFITAAISGYEEITLHSGSGTVELTDKTIATVSGTVEITAKPTTSAILIAEMSDVILMLEDNAVLTVTGGSASGMTGAGAGIELPESSSLTICGTGTLNVTGGAAANGDPGQDGGNGLVVYDEEWCYSGAGGNGGNGGGGAGAGIGGIGGNGGKGGKGGGGLSREADGSEVLGSGLNGSNGAPGTRGGSCGSVTVCDTVVLNVNGGSASGNPSAGGIQGRWDTKEWSKYYRAFGGGGGGAGGNGYVGAKIGSGGSGGAGGGGGGGGIIDYWYTFSDIEQCQGTGLGGKGGYGSTGGGNGGDNGASHDITDGYSAGLGGNSGVNGFDGMEKQDVAYLRSSAVSAAAGLVYNGETQTGVSGGTGYTLSGKTSAVDAGTYTATATLIDGYCWNDGTVDPKTVEWTIEKQKVAVPEFRCLDHTGRTMTFYKDTALYTVTNGRAADVGTYTAVFTLKDGKNYAWDNDRNIGETEYEIHLYADENHDGKCDRCEEYYNTVYISTAQQFIDFTADTNRGNDYSGKTVVLTADLDLNNIYNNIYSVADFRGTFDGGGHTITCPKSPYNIIYAPFSYIENATVKNLTIAGYTGAAGIVKIAINSSVINCVNRAGTGFAGIVRTSNGSTITGCINYATIKTVSQMSMGCADAAGIVMDAGDYRGMHTIISGCMNYGELIPEEKGHGAGILCNWNGSTKIFNCAEPNTVDDLSAYANALNAEADKHVNWYKWKVEDGKLALVEPDCVYRAERAPDCGGGHIAYYEKDGKYYATGEYDSLIGDIDAWLETPVENGGGYIASQHIDEDGDGYCDICEYDVAASACDVTYLDRIVNDDNTVTTKEAALDHARRIGEDDTVWGADAVEETTWYVLDSDVTLKNRPEVKGKVAIVLKNGCTLTADHGITLMQGNTLTVYAQSDDRAVMGKLTGTAASCDAVIGTRVSENINFNNVDSAGDLIWKGGCLELTSRSAACIGGGSGNGWFDSDIACAGANGGTVKIYGGILSLTAGQGVCIGGGNGGSGMACNDSYGMGGKGGDGGTLTVTDGSILLSSASYACIGGGKGGKSDNSVKFYPDGEPGADTVLTIAYTPVMKAGDDAESAKTVTEYGGEKYFSVVYSHEYTISAFASITGGAYIDTGFIPTKDTRVVMDVSVNGGTEYWFGVWDVNYKQNAFALGNDELYGGVYAGYGNQGGTDRGSPVPNGRHTVELDKNKVYIDGVERTSIVHSYSADGFPIKNSLYLFAQNRNGVALIPDGQKITFYSCRIFENGTLVHYYVPAVYSGTGEQLIYDAAEDEYLSFSGGGNVTSGGTQTFVNLLERTSVRTSGTPGLRFAAYVADAQREASASYGFLVARENDDLAENPEHLVFNDAHSTLGKNAFGITYTSGEAYNKAEGIDSIYARDGEAFGMPDVEATFFTGVMTGIPKAYYAENLIARPYIVIGNVTLYGETYAKNLYASACAIRDGGYQGLDEDGINYIGSIISAVDNEVAIDIGELTE